MRASFEFFFQTLRGDSFGGDRRGPSNVLSININSTFDSGYGDEL